ncbi:hypothetical protein KUTeg_003385 [Tegillarca granosa]|uniref:Ketimine reductase mu-crystallin n=1 Tax=Tegillarca granosa TaxID=220873 RepID=A0ABQ9FLZ4_TEGGR|nr:hypothetical protein KUTeg_003385 [Tegillarca granosa]
MEFIPADEVKRVLTFSSLIPVMETALKKFSNDQVVQPVRSVVHVKDSDGFLGVMPALSSTDGTLATKLVTFFPNNKGIPTHHAIIAMFNTSTGVPELIMDGKVITTMRTAAVSAVATKYLARSDSKILAILGAGVQARSHFAALTSLFNFDEVRVWSRTFTKAQELANEISGKACETASEAVKDADVIVTVTASPVPVLNKEWVKNGAHINAVGACRPDWHEIHPDLMNSSTVYVDSRAAAIKESGDVILSNAEIYAEIGEVMLGTKEGEKTKTTVFKSLGLAIEDALSAKLVRELLSK